MAVYYVGQTGVGVGWGWGDKSVTGTGGSFKFVHWIHTSNQLWRYMASLIFQNPLNEIGRCFCGHQDNLIAVITLSYLSYCN